MTRCIDIFCQRIKNETQMSVGDEIQSELFSFVVGYEDLESGAKISGIH